MLTNNEKGLLLFKKKEYIAKVLDYFITDSKLQDECIIKLIDELQAKKVITADMQKLLKMGLMQYKFTIVDTLAQCNQLHIRLYDDTDKSYKKSHTAFYRNIENKE